MSLLDSPVSTFERTRPGEGDRRPRRWPPGALAFFALGVLAGLLHARLLGLL